MRSLVLAGGALLFLAVLCAAQPAIPPSPAAWVTDNANFMSGDAVARLNARLEAYQQQTGHQLLVWIGSTTGADPIEDFAVRTFAAWKVGRKGIDDGLVLFIMAQDRKLRIEVGYGLEGQVPDAIASRIINEVIVPQVRAGDTDTAVTAGMESVAQAIGQPLPGAAVSRTPRGATPLTLGQLIIYGILGLVVLFILATNPSLAIFLLASTMGGGRRRGGWGGGGGGFGGGGFGGGGGRSGGGGASGSW